MQPQKIALTVLITLLATISPSVTGLFLSSFPTARTLALTQDTRKTSADQLIQQGITQYQQGKLDAAIQSWQQALKIYQQLKERQGEATALGNLGAAYLATGNYKQAIASLRPPTYEQRIAASTAEDPCIICPIAGANIEEANGLK